MIQSTSSAYDFSNAGRVNPHDLAIFRTVDIYDVEYGRPVIDIHDWNHDGFTSPTRNFRPRASSLCRQFPTTCAGLFDNERHGARRCEYNR
jgi:hypothetical protein